MSTLADRALSGTEAPLSETASAGNDGAEAAIADLAANTRLTAKARVIRDYYGSVLRRRKPIEFEPILPPPTLTPAEHGFPLKAPILPERSWTSLISYHALQQWEGYVTSIAAESFTADLVDITREARMPEEQVELPLDEVGPEQSLELHVGAVFRWTIGYETLPSGQRRRVSQLVFRQLPRWTQADIDAAKQLGSERHGRIRWE